VLSGGRVTARRAPFLYWLAVHHVAAAVGDAARPEWLRRELVEALLASPVRPGVHTPARLLTAGHAQDVLRDVARYDLDHPPAVLPPAVAPLLAAAPAGRVALMVGVCSDAVKFVS
jgi:hypothetical protein